MENAPLAQAGGSGLEAPTADLQSLASWRCPTSSQTPAVIAEVARRETARGSPGHARQPGEAHSRHRRRQILAAATAAGAGGTLGSAAHGPPHPACLDPQTW